MKVTVQEQLPTIISATTKMHTKKFLRKCGNKINKNINSSSLSKMKCQRNYSNDMEKFPFFFYFSFQTNWMSHWNEIMEEKYSAYVAIITEQNQKQNRSTTIRIRLTRRRRRRDKTKTEHTKQPWIFFSFYPNFT